MGLHHATLKAAVLVYAALIGTMTEESLKAEIAKDEKGFSPEEVDEIYAAVVKAQAELKADNVATQENQAAAAVVETPDWVAKLLASNKATQVSNQLVIDAIGQFKELAADLVKQVVSGSQGSVVETTGSSDIKINIPEYDEDADYEVLVPFRDSLNFAKVYEKGDDVSHLGKERIKHLLITGNIAEA
jgi:hypothetical protein